MAQRTGSSAGLRSLGLDVRVISGAQSAAKAAVARVAAGESARVVRAELVGQWPAELVDMALAHELSVLGAEIARCSGAKAVVQ